MSDIREFVYRGEIRGQGRPKAGRRGNHATVYKDARDRLYEYELRNAYLEEWEGCDQIRGPFRLEICAYFKTPETWSKSKKVNSIGKPCEKKPDVDNVIKAVLDALNGIAFEDDKHCFLVQAVKTWSFSNRLLVRIEREEENENERNDEPGGTTDKASDDPDREPVSEE